MNNFENKINLIHESVNTPSFTDEEMIRSLTEEVTKHLEQSQKLSNESINAETLGEKKAFNEKNSMLLKKVQTLLKVVRDLRNNGDEKYNVVLPFKKVTTVRSDAITHPATDILLEETAFLEKLIHDSQNIPILKAQAGMIPSDKEGVMSGEIPFILKRQAE